MKIGIVGAGISGLACALDLRKAGLSVKVFEQSGHVGGRVRSDQYEGFILDHGFQVFLDSYDLVPEYFKLENLSLKKFKSGALIRHSDHFSYIGNPIAEVKSIPQTIFSPVASLKDKLLILKMILKNKNKKNSTTLEFLKNYGFSKKIIEKFFTPFFSGVFLDKNLEVDSRFFLYLFEKFSKANVSLPQNGIQELAENLANQIGRKNIKLNTKVNSLSKNSINKEDFDIVIIATDQHSYQNLTNGSSEVQMNAVETHYYKTKSQEYAYKALFLNPEKDGPVNHIACLSAVASSYAPKGEHLYSVNIIQPKHQEDISQENSHVRAHLKMIFGDKEINQWNWLKTYRVDRALPRSPYYGSLPIKENGIYRCGDYLQSPSIQGALESARRVSTHIIKFS